jgi:hypothetical protein
MAEVNRNPSPPVDQPATPMPSPTPADARPPAPSLPPLQPVFVEPGILFNHTGRRGRGPFKVTTQFGSNYFLKLVDKATQRDSVGIYVIGGQEIEVDVPLGTYELRYAAGKQWYGYDHRFGPETSYSKSDSTFYFTEDVDGYSGYSIELIPQAGGNMETWQIPEAQF